MKIEGRIIRRRCRKYAKKCKEEKQKRKKGKQEH